MSRMNLMEESRGAQVEGFCMVKSCAVRTDSKGASYMDMTVADAGGECAAKLWNYNIAAYGTFDPEDVVKIRATINIWKDVEQLKVERIRLATPEDNVDMSRLVPCAPEDPQKYFDYLWNLSDEFTDKDLKKLVQYFLDAFRQEILRFPAGVKLHHATRGGWLQHTCAVVRMGRAICQLYPALDRDLVTAGATLHDIGKLYELQTGKLGLATAYTPEGQLLGHINIGISLIHNAADRLDIPEETAMLLEHMLLSHHGQPEFGSPKFPMFPEAEVLSECDLLDSRLFEMFDALSTVSKGGFSDRLWALDNRQLYQHGRKGSGEN